MTNHGQADIFYRRRIPGERMQNHKKSIDKKTIMVFIILFAVLIYCVLEYKSEVVRNHTSRVRYTLMATHKENGEAVLSGEHPELSEDFICRVPQLQKIQIEGITKKSGKNARLLLEITEPDSRKTFYKKEAPVSFFFKSRKTRREISLRKLPKDTEGLLLRLHMKLILSDSAGNTASSKTGMKLILTANSKPGTVVSFDGEAEGGSNIVYRMKYSRLSETAGLFWFLCLCILLALLTGYYLIMVREWRPEKWFPVIAVMMGLILQWVIPVYGVPDEPWHMDTAYQLSNRIMFVDKDPQPGTVLKRECDIIAADLLANDVESNSYYQLWKNSAVTPADTSLRRVNYVDTCIQVPAIVYVPAALGIIAGRILHLSGMITYQLARIFSLLAYVLIAWLAIRIIPFCKHLLAMIATSAIALQQAASASYDAVINSCIFLFTALCLNLTYDPDKKNSRPYTVVMIILALFISMIKGGAYIPVLLLMLLLLWDRYGRGEKKIIFSRKLLLIGAGAAAAAMLLMVWRFYPVMNSLVLGIDNASGNFTIAHILRHPIGVALIYWRTLIHTGEKILRGLLGGMLGWLTIKISWLFIMPVFTGLLLLANVENERPPRKMNYRILSLAIIILTAILIMTGMLFAETSVGALSIRGVQGRYFIPVELLLLSLCSTPMVTVDRGKAGGVVLSIILIEMLALIHVTACCL